MARRVQTLALKSEREFWGKRWQSASYASCKLDVFSVLHLNLTFCFFSLHSLSVYCCSFLLGCPRFFCSYHPRPILFLRPLSPLRAHLPLLRSIASVTSSSSSSASSVYSFESDKSKKVKNKQSAFAAEATEAVTPSAPVPASAFVPASDEDLFADSSFVSVSWTNAVFCFCLSSFHYWFCCQRCVQSQA